MNQAGAERIMHNLINNAHTNDRSNDNVDLNYQSESTNEQSDLAAVWLAEGQSSQRDMLESLQALKTQSNTPLNIIASHRHERPEIFEFADTVYYEPSVARLDADDSEDEDSASTDNNAQSHVKTVCSAVRR